MNSTVLPPPTREELQAEQERALEEELRLDAGVKRLERMSAVKSIHRNLKLEDAAVQRDIDDHRQELGMSSSSVNPGPHKVSGNGDDPVEIGEIMSARDTQIHYYMPGSEPTKKNDTPPTPPPPPVIQPQPIAPLPQPSGMRPWVRNLIIGAGMIGTGATAAIATYFLARPDTPAVSTPATPDKDTTVTIEGH